MVHPTTTLCRLWRHARERSAPSPSHPARPGVGRLAYIGAPAPTAAAPPAHPLHPPSSHPPGRSPACLARIPHAAPWGLGRPPRTALLGGCVYRHSPPPPPPPRVAGDGGAPAVPQRMLARPQAGGGVTRQRPHRTPPCVPQMRASAAASGGRRPPSRTGRTLRGSCRPGSPAPPLSPRRTTANTVLQALQQPCSKACYGLSPCVGAVLQFGRP
jgi:hypothetical protein